MKMLAIQIDLASEPCPPSPTVVPDDRHHDRSGQVRVHGSTARIRSRFAVTVRTHAQSKVHVCGSTLPHASMIDSAISRRDAVPSVIHRAFSFLVFGFTRLFLISNDATAQPTPRERGGAWGAKIPASWVRSVHGMQLYSVCQLIERLCTRSLRY